MAAMKLRAVLCDWAIARPASAGPQRKHPTTRCVPVSLPLKSWITLLDHYNRYTREFNQSPSILQDLDRAGTLHREVSCRPKHE
jgi:hypothetical protein